MSDTVIRRHLIVRGDVQGVFFRASVRDRAQKAGVTGYVRNRDDGTVEAEFQGPVADVEEMVETCRSDPGHSTVRSVDVEEREPVDDEYDFRVG